MLHITQKATPHPTQVAHCSNICTKLQTALMKSQHKTSKLSTTYPSRSAFLRAHLMKMQMLQYYYDILNNFFAREKFELSQMDTDSMYFAVSGDSLEDILKPMTLSFP